ncbi:hypothetical protein P280DRAFT_527437 [Massarina eburnea CBS 473.64]|uniref:Uncharacterized protein n=1 Tax=Massarina eburnea CBS 473.64 TaxID=1395130 RepID=A0A6A6RYJ2_9PLEO|nr:hypothetical protein P280DRAFT_527437 [Massarina eburnea CBS 473.64]
MVLSTTHIPIYNTFNHRIHESCSIVKIPGAVSTLVTIPLFVIVYTLDIQLTRILTPEHSWVFNEFNGFTRNPTWFLHYWLDYHSLF